MHGWFCPIRLIYLITLIKIYVASHIEVLTFTSEVLANNVPQSRFLFNELYWFKD